MFFPLLPLPLAQAQPSTPPAAQVRLAKTHFSQGLKAYQSGTLEDLQRAKTEWEQAQTLWQQLGDRPQEMVTRNFLCLLEENLGDYPASLTCYQALLQLTQTANSAPHNDTLGDRQTEASTLTALARLQSRLGNYQEALERLEQAQKVWQVVGFKTGEVSALNEKALVYFNLGDWQQAARFYQQALAIAKPLGNEATVASLYENLAQVAVESGEYDQALNLSQEANQRWDLLLQKLGNSANLEIKRGKAATLNNIAFIYVQQNQLTSAEAYYRQALAQWQTIGDLPGTASALNNLGYVYFLQGQVQPAQDYYQQALALRQRIGDRPKEALSHYRLAQLARQQGKLREAKQAIEQTLKIVEDIRINIANNNLKTSFLASKQDYYQFYIDLLMQLHRQDPKQGWDAQALAASERAKARSLLDLLAQTPGDISTDIPPHLLRQRDALKARLSRLEADRLQLFVGDRYQAEQQQRLEEDIADALQRYREILDQMSLANPRYGQLTQPKTLTLKEIQALLDPETALLEYAVGPDRSYLWIVTSHQLVSYELPKEEALTEAVKAFRNSFLQPNQRIQRVLAQEQGKRLGKRVLPLSPLPKRLAIVADGPLQYLPFAALAQENGAHTPPRYLIDDHEVINLPSASVLAQLRRELATRRSAPQGLAIFANPVFSLDDDRLKNTVAAPKPLPPDLARSAQESGVLFQRLPYTQEEAEQILALAPAQQNLSEIGFAANRQQVFSPSLRQYRYVHFATHGLLNSQNPQLSGLVLSLFDPKGRPINGFLRLYDIFNLQLPAELVVLSACETGLGQAVRGEGLIGLTRGFMYAGAARVVVSLWSVDDQATALLMTRFYQGILDENLSPAIALQQAQQWLKGQPRFASPYYWAGFVLQGDW